MAKIPRGLCTHCNRVISYKNSFKHLERCPNKGTSYNAHLVKIQWPLKEPLYWMYLSVPYSCSLKKLDQLLRDTWVECCNHASRFATRGCYFISNSKNPMPVKVGDKYMADMDFPSGGILNLVKKKLTYEYDFENNANTTELSLVVVKSYKSPKRDQASILMQNVKPLISCSYCKNEAMRVLGDCNYLCDLCAAVNENSPSLLPLVNSPRTGVCKYVGIIDLPPRV